MIEVLNALMKRHGVLSFEFVETEDGIFQRPKQGMDIPLYYFEAKDKFYQDFNAAETFDAQVEVVSKLIDDVCLYYLK